ncbi:uncharacterized protein LOC144438262 [Glandiceps talaboti]
MIGQGMDDDYNDYEDETPLWDGDINERTDTTVLTPSLGTFPPITATTTTTTKSQTTSSEPRPRTKYLLPILKMWGGGNNVEFQSFKNVVMFALLLNRTIVLTPFYEHGGHSRDGYTLPETLRHFNETFDVNRLRELIPVATVEEYREDCPQLDLVLYWNTTYWPYTSKLHEDNLQLPIPSLDDTKRTPENAWDILQRRNDQLRCVGFYDPHRYTADIPNEEAVLSNIDKYVVRTTQIKEAGDLIVPDICDGQPYLALHYRNKTGEGCHFFLDVRQERCDMLIPMISSIADMVTKIVTSYMTKYGLECLYVAHPLWSGEIVNHLALKVPRNKIYSSGMILNSEDSRLSLYKNDVYFLSLLEQEICSRASLFLGCGRSNWSSFVWKERMAEGKGQSYFLNQLPEVPREYHKHL